MNKLVGIRLPVTLIVLIEASGYSLTKLIRKLLLEFFKLTEADCQ